MTRSLLVTCINIYWFGHMENQYAMNGWSLDDPIMYLKMSSLLVYLLLV